MELERKGGSRKMQERYLRWDRGKDIKILKGTNAEGNDEKQSGEGGGRKVWGFEELDMGKGDKLARV